VDDGKLPQQPKVRQQPRRKMITEQLKIIHEMHLNAIKWNNDVQQVIQFNFLVEFSVLSTLICLSIYTIADKPFDSAYIDTLLIVLLTQLFVYCWMENRVIKRIDELTAAVYNIAWYSFDVDHMKVVEMMLGASQEHARLSRKLQRTQHGNVSTGWCVCFSFDELIYFSFAYFLPSQ
jgi:7tm Odorant receptor